MTDQNTPHDHERDDLPTLTIHKDTGQWVSGGCITGEQGKIMASSLLPGTTPEAVRAWYETYMEEG